MKVRTLKLTATVAAAAAAAVCAVTPVAPDARRVAVVHMHAPSPRAQTPNQNALLHGPEQSPASSMLRPALRPVATPSPLRPVFPRWFHRRHIAAAPPGVA